MKHLKKFNESDEFSKRDNESTDEWLERLDVEFKRSSSNIKKTFSDMKKDGVVAFCKECGCNIYKDIEHICGENTSESFLQPLSVYKEKLANSGEDSMALLYEWVQKKYISLEEFKELIDFNFQ